MTYVNWSTNVNTKFYAYSKVPQDNRVSNEYASGRKTVILKNTRFVNDIKCSLYLDKRKNEVENFWNWFTATLGGTAGVFYCSALGTNFYRFKSVPNVEETQTGARLDLEIEEIY